MDATQDLTRRQVVGAGAGIAGAGIALGITRGPARALAASCATLTPIKTIGPYFVEESLNRSDITTDPGTGAVVAGIPLALHLTLIDDDNGCVPLAGAQVDIWHASPAGLYSDEAAEGTSGKKYLRGYQVSDAAGNVTFQTVYPGWYSGRAVHIHVRIRLFTGTTATYDFLTQLFFDDALTDAVYSMSPYDARPGRDTRDAADSIYGSDGASVRLAPTSVGAGGYVAPFSFSLSRSNQGGGTAAGAGGPGGGAPTQTAPTTTTTSTTTTPKDTVVLASLKSVAFSRTALGTRVMHVVVKTKETIAVDISLRRGTKTLLHRKRAALLAGTHSLKIALPRTIGAGRTTIAVTATDLRSNTKSQTKIIQIPAP